MRQLIVVLLFGGLLSLFNSGCGSSHHGGGGSSPPPPPATLSVTTPTTLPAAVHSQAYSIQLQASGGHVPYSWITIGGSQPPVNLTGSGLLSGIPNQVGTFTFTLRVLDSGTPPPQTSADATFTLDVQ